ncbi:hypothetical protein [Pseudomonas viridiflava]|uniref:hypothetical protein n=1 Tax=Pseudomonas viridiflava TaxID=33069 RepID=UPI0013CF21BE|nr:hypothetical protein [Pseudomonas viridiflava]
MKAIALATEDELSEAVGLRLLSEWGLLDEMSPLLLRKNGSGYLRSRMDSWLQMAHQHPVVIITDLDRVKCPSLMLSDWLAGKTRPENFLLRIAVREMESWVLADHVAVRKLIGDKGKLPPLPDELPDPKSFLLTLAKSAPRSIKDELVRSSGSISSQGIGYNRRLVELVNSDWSPERASERSPSLVRARRRLYELALRCKA